MTEFSLSGKLSPAEISHLRQMYQKDVNYSIGRDRFEYVLLKVNKEFEPGKRFSVLDIGCGSDKSSITDAGENESRMFEPWFARAVALEFGIPVVGVDRYPQSAQDNGLYTHITVDIIPLIMAGTFSSLFPTAPFDLVHSNALFVPDGTTFRRAMERSRHLFPEDRRTSYDMMAKTLLEKFMLQAKGVLKPNGILAIDNDFWTLNENNELVPSR